MTRRFIRKGGLVAMVLCIVACTSDNVSPDSAPPPESERWPALNSELNYVWSAEPGIDLLEAPAVIVRAYFESTMNASEAGNEALLYPGYARAVVEADAQPGSLELWPPLRGAYGKERVGTIREHILRLTDKGSTVEAVVCHWVWGMATLRENGLYSSGEDNPGPDAGVNTMRLTLARPGDPASSLPPQEGPSKYPVDDVFGDWRVIGRLDEAQPLPTQDTIRPEFQQDRDTCIARAPESAERRQFLRGGEHPRSDFPTLPPYPGWPAESD